MPVVYDLGEQGVLPLFCGEHPPPSCRQGRQPCSYIGPDDDKARLLVLKVHRHDQGSGCVHLPQLYTPILPWSPTTAWACW